MKRRAALLSVSYLLVATLALAVIALPFGPGYVFLYPVGGAIAVGVLAFRVPRLSFGWVGAGSLIVAASGSAAVFAGAVLATVASRVEYGGTGLSSDIMLCLYMAGLAFFIAILPTITGAALASWIEARVRRRAEPISV